MNRIDKYHPTPSIINTHKNIIVWSNGVIDWFYTDLESTRITVDEWLTQMEEMCAKPNVAENWPLPEFPPAYRYTSELGQLKDGYTLSQELLGFLCNGTINSRTETWLFPTDEFQQ